MSPCCTANARLVQRGGTLDDRISGVKPPSVPSQLDAPVGEKLVLVLHATGFQINTCQHGTASKSSWALKMPQADLCDDDGHVVGKHYAGPTWKHNDGSEITAKPVARAEAPSPGAVPWLLLTVTGRSGAGVLERVSSIQRIETSGGQAPQIINEGTKAGDELKLSYSADYYFYAPSK